MAKRALVSLPDGVWRIIDELKGTLGDGDSEIIRNIIIAHLTEKGILLPSYKIVGSATGDNLTRVTHEARVEALFSVLAEKKIVTQQELERKIKQRLAQHSPVVGQRISK